METTNSTGLVLLVMTYATILYPSAFWKIALALAGWFLFARAWLRNRSHWSAWLRP
ncbi:MAG: hypothetical protein ABSE51_13590 [Terracidiphilus sp.]